MYIGIDLGTSGVKAILLNEQGEVVASHTEKLTVSRPHPLWSEQDPEQWWLATDTAMKALGAQYSLRDVKALGIAGQMHGATLLDKSLQVLRPAILWNDGRCAEECQLLEDKVSASRQITGNLMMPGFTAPKLLWVQRHEAAVFSQVDKVLLPKDYLRLRMTGRGRHGRCRSGDAVAGHLRRLLRRQRRVPQQTRKRGAQLLPCPAGPLAFDVGDAQRGLLSGLGGKINRSRQRAGADRGGADGG